MPPSISSFLLPILYILTKYEHRKKYYTHTHTVVFGVCKFKKTREGKFSYECKFSLNYKLLKRKPSTHFIHFSPMPQHFFSLLFLF